MNAQEIQDTCKAVHAWAKGGNAPDPEQVRLVLDHLLTAVCPWFDIETFEGEVPHLGLKS